ncbi:MAG: DUF2079 domain-containing protein [Clostridia bacterium]|nr:DUF2079 domain-containing protein [Clostridia bacterium]
MKLKKLLGKLKQHQTEKYIVNLLIAYCLGAASILLYCRVVKGIRFNGLELMAEVPLLPALSALFGLFTALNVLRFFIKKERLFRLLLFAAVTVYFGLLSFFGYTVWFCLFLFIFCAVAAYYCFGRKDDPPLQKTAPQGAFLLVCAVLMFLFISVETCLRYADYRADALDMGVYSQLLENLSRGRGAAITVRGNGTENFFSTQPALLLYLLLPLWIVFRNMYPLLILQAAALATGAVPLYLILKRRDVHKTQVNVVTAVYFLFPGIWAGAFYDFHIEAFLVPFVLWALYFAERGKTVPYAVLILLTLLVGVEGLIIAVALGLYLFFSEKQRFQAMLTFLFSAVFILIFVRLSPGARVPDSQTYGNLAFLQYLIKNPTYLLRNLLNEQKLGFVVLTLGCVGFLPFFAKKKSLLLLLLPMLFINLLGYDYDASVQYHHAFGSGALLLYAFAVSLPQLGEKKRAMASAFCILACLLPFCGLILPQANHVRDRIKNREIYTAIETALERVPENAGVSASSRLTPRLARREILYVYYPPVVNADGTLSGDPDVVYQTDYTVLLLHDDAPDLNKAQADALLAEGFAPVVYEDGIIAVLKK